MKKSAVFIILAIMTFAARATTMCAQNGTMAVVLDPMVNGTSHSYNADLFEWYTNFSYGTVYGIATCVDVNSMTNGELVDSNGTLATGGERTGVHCWCKMTHPALSRWVFRSSNGSVGDCRSDCATNCGSNVRSARRFAGACLGRSRHDTPVCGNGWGFGGGGPAPVGKIAYA